MTSLRNLCAAIETNCFFYTPTSSSSMACRICLEDGTLYKLPCACRDAIGYVHAPCFVRWMMTRVSRPRGHACDVCGAVYAKLETKLGSGYSVNEYAAAIQTIIRCLHAFLVYSITMFSFCFYHAATNKLPLDDDTWNAGVVIIFLLAAGTLIHVYNFMTCKLPVDPDTCQSVLHHFIQSCDRVESVEV